MAFRVPNQYRVRTHPLLGSDDSIGSRGAFLLPHPIESGVHLFCMADEGTVDDEDRPLPPEHQWEHVSVSVRVGSATRMPTWGEMCFIKEQFWEREDCVLQFHPPRSEYVNAHPHVLHLWRHRTFVQPRPPKWMVG